ncbi:4a-hydroxytetrahydrobiopterin dehydratase [Candidatus Parcubacteria bacterium]|nr:4a-hydroxytetrahydrobiopterin dehydratase [Candidatus Parcubacteria bacterium]
MEKLNILSEEQIKEGLKSLPGWSYADDKISKQFEFKDFMDSLGFVTKMAPVFEANDHHPDTCIMYSKIRFDLHRFDVGDKVTDRDLLIAGEIEKAYEERV